MEEVADARGDHPQRRSQPALAQGEVADEPHPRPAGQIASETAVLGDEENVMAFHGRFEVDKLAHVAAAGAGQAHTRLAARAWAPAP